MFAAGTGGDPPTERAFVLASGMNALYDSFLADGLAPAASFGSVRATIRAPFEDPEALVDFLRFRFGVDPELPDVWLDDENDVRPRALENDPDPARRKLADRVNETLTRIARNPGDASVRRHRFQSVDAWAVTVPGDDEDWVILWAPHQTEPDVILVPYVGPASFA